MIKQKPFRFGIVILGFLLLMLSSSFVSFALAQNIAMLTIREGNNERFFIITEGQPHIVLTFHVEQKTNSSTVSAQLYATDLWDQARARVVSAENSIKVECDKSLNGTSAFSLAKNSYAIVTVTIDTSQVKAGTYSGKIVVFGIDTTDLEIPVRIQVRVNLVWVAGANLFGIVLGFVAQKLGVNLPKVRSGKRTLKDLGDEVKNWWKVQSTYILPVAAGIVLIGILFLVSFQTYYSRITDFGADPVDYVGAILFGLGQFGAGKATVEIGKTIQDKK